MADRRSAHPSIPGWRSKVRNPGRKSAPRERGSARCLRYRQRKPRVRSSLLCPLPQGEVAREAIAMHFGETNPIIILAKRTQRIPLGSSPRGAPRDSKSAFTRVCDALCVAGTPLRGPITTVFGYGSRLSLRSAGTTIAWSERRTNLRLHKITAGVISLFPACYLQ